MSATIFLKDEILKKIKSDPELFGKVAIAVGVAPLSMMRKLQKKDPAFTQKNVLVLLSEYLNVSEDDLFPIQAKKTA